MRRGTPCPRCDDEKHVGALRFYYGDICFDYSEHRDGSSIYFFLKPPCPGPLLPGSYFFVIC